MTPALPTAAPRPSAPLVRASLRPYQKEGVAWLQWVNDAGPGGVLADDMGLGKTLQTIASIAFTHAQRGGKYKVLIVTTSSTVYNWARELHRFAPQLPVSVWQGANRRKKFVSVFNGPFAVIITSYGTARSDEKLLAQLPPFSLVILDEAQTIKTAGSATLRMAHAVPAHRRLALTGTPIENGPEDFYSVFDWAVPGLLGPRKWFKDVYVEALREGDETLAKRLQALTRPYLLRRKKTDEGVAADLPTKTEIRHPVTLPPRHALIYRELELAIRKQLAGAELAGQIDSSQTIAMFAAITKMRQAACDPRLLGIAFEGGGKMLEAVHLVQRARTLGEKTIVFSSFAQMLYLLDADFRRRGIGTSVLTGDVAIEDRQDVIDLFSADPNRHVILVSLKAGGAGINIVAASTVIHFDPWWNPAAEDQATDRAYRIGQKRAVTVYKLVAKHTVEERVLRTLASKRDVADLLLGEATPGEITPAQAVKTASSLLSLIRTDE